jgi:predicted nucleic acid-binding protein
MPFEGSFLHEALPMVKKGWKLGDAVHYATMKKHNIKEIVTDDAHFENAEGVERVDILETVF